MGFASPSSKSLPFRLAQLGGCTELLTDLAIVDRLFGWLVDWGLKNPSTAKVTGPIVDLFTLSLPSTSCLFDSQ